MVRTKKKIQGKCDKCLKKLLVPSWKYCADCDFENYKKRYLKNQIQILKETILKEKPKKDKFKNASTIVIDEKGKIIGYRL